MIGYHDGYLAAPLVVEALGTLAPSLQHGGIGHHLYIIKVQRADKFLYTARHALTFARRKLALLTLAPAVSAKHLAHGVVSPRQLFVAVGSLALTL